MSDAKIKRLRELMTAVTQGREAVSREFTMRVPAEPDRDADLVLQWAADHIESLQRELNDLRKSIEVKEARALQERYDFLQRENEVLREKLSAVERQKHFYCIWEGCDQEAMYCEGHAHELVNPLGMEISPEAFHRQSLPTITPEMRERMQTYMDWHCSNPITRSKFPAENPAAIFSDLLGEQG